MMRKIGVTGGTGFIGQYLIRDYSDKFDFVVATSREVSNAAGIYCHTDYSKDSLKGIFMGCDAIVHLGSKVPNKVTTLDPIEPYLESVSMTDQLLRAAVELGIKRFVFTSTVSVYEKKEGSELFEDMLCQPDNPYGVSKAATEMLCRLYEKRHGIEPIILRVSQVLGYREYKTPGFYSMLLNNAYEGKAITLYGEGTACRDYVYVKDVCRAIECALREQAAAGIYNIGMGTPISNLALAETYCKVFDNAAGIVHIPVEREDAWNYHMNIRKARDELGWESEYDLTAMVTDIRTEMLRAREQKV